MSNNIEQLRSQLYAASNICDEEKSKCWKLCISYDENPQYLKALERYENIYDKLEQELEKI